MEIVEVPSNVNVIAIPSNLISAKIGKKNDAYILVIMKRKPVIDVGCGARHRCIVAIDLLPSGGLKLERIEPEPLHFGITATPPKLMLSRKLNNGQFKLALVFEDDVEKLNKGELVSPRIVEIPPYLVFERVSSNKFKLSNREPEAAIVIYSYELDSRVTCADIDIVESELLLYKVCSTCCATRSISIMVGVGKEGQRIRIKQRSAYYKEKLPDIEKTLTIRHGKLVETEDISIEDIL